MGKRKKKEERNLCIVVQGLTGVYLFRLNNPKDKMGLMSVRVDKRPLREGMFYKRLV